jgi:23S rRNA pseudouridine1911/1915/1917 synthase
MSEQISLQAEVPTELGGKRLDQVLAQLFPDYSRSRIKTWILDDKITVDGEILNTPREKLFGGETVNVETSIEAPREYLAQDIKLNIVYEDDDILVINKPMGLVVHPGAGNPDGTVLNALLHHYPDIINVPRAGIVHRLDKDTTGLMVVAKTIQAQTHLWLKNQLVAILRSVHTWLCMSRVNQQLRIFVLLKNSVRIRDYVFV